MEGDIGVVIRAMVSLSWAGWGSRQSRIWVGVSEQFLNGTSARNRPFRSLLSSSKVLRSMKGDRSNEPGSGCHIVMARYSHKKNNRYDTILCKI